MTQMTPFPAKLRVVFTGHAGTSKQQVVERFTDFVRAKLESNGVTRTVGFADAEALLKPIGSFLGLDRPIQQQRWARSVRRQVQSLQGVDYAFLSLHLSYRSYSRFFSPVSWRASALAAAVGHPTETLLDLIGTGFQPDYFVCLIDDIHVARQRIATGKEGIHLRLSELLAWRNFEALLTDFLAQETILGRGTVNDSPEAPFDRSPMVANRHPQEMLFRYLFEPTRLRIYASFPITRTRYRDDSRAEIDDFRYALHSQFCVFDPVTIDELPLTSLLGPEKKGGRRAPPSGAVRRRPATLDLPASARWPLDVKNTLSGQEIRAVEDLSLEEIQEITRRTDGRDRTELAQSVQDRDYRLIDQSDCVVVYRPQYSLGLAPTDKSYQAPTGGTAAEIHYALSIAGKPVYIIHDEHVDGPLRREVLDRLLPQGNNYYLQQSRLAERKNRTDVFERLVSRLREDQAVLVAKRE